MSVNIVDLPFGYFLDGGLVVNPDLLHCGEGVCRQHLGPNGAEVAGRIISAHDFRKVAGERVLLDERQKQVLRVQPLHDVDVRFSLDISAPNKIKT
jgi:hypothetical protein